jgi:hypothetical protein
MEVIAPGAERPGAVMPTQREAIQRARQILAKIGGGELRIRRRNGVIREQDTVRPGNDPRSSRG